MKLISPQNLRKVDYFGIEVLVPDGVTFLATDADGGVYMYAECPEEGDGRWFNYSDVYFVCKIDLEGVDWKDTLTWL